MNAPARELRAEIERLQAELELARSDQTRLAALEDRCAALQLRVAELESRRALDQRVHQQLLAVKAPAPRRPFGIPPPDAQGAKWTFLGLMAVLGFLALIWLTI